MGTSSLGEAGDTKKVQYQIGNRLFEKSILVTEAGFSTIPGTERLVEEFSDSRTNLKNIRKGQRLHVCPA